MQIYSRDLVFTSGPRAARKERRKGGRKCWNEAVCHTYCEGCERHTNHASPPRRFITNPCHVWIWQLWMNYSSGWAINAHYGVRYAVWTGLEKSCHAKEGKMNNTPNITSKFQACGRTHTSVKAHTRVLICPAGIVLPCSLLILSFNMIDRGVKHTWDYAPRSIVNRQKTKESACEQADWQDHHYPGNKSTWQQHKNGYQRNACAQRVRPSDKTLLGTAGIKRTLLPLAFKCL